MKSIALFALASVAASVPAAAFAQAQPAARQAPPTAGDPNQVICEKQEVIGSRIATKKICMKRWEWAEKRQLDRSEVEKAQTQVGMKGE